MSVEQVIVNPIGWAQIKLLGGPKRILYSGGFYAGILLIINIILYRVLSGTGMTIPQFAAGSLRVLLYLQAGFMVLGGAGAIRKAVQRDFTTDMITSHRSTAMTGNTAVLGYLIGSTANVLVFSLINWLSCTILAVLAGNRPYEPALLFVFLGGMAAMFWTFGTVLALSTRGTASAVGLTVGLGVFMGMNNLFVVCPGLSLLVGAQIIANLSGAIVPVSGVENSIFVSIISQLLIAAIFYMAAARKFIRDDIPAFNLPLALLLLALCSLLSGLGLRYWTAPATNLFNNSTTDYQLRIQTIVTTGALALVALLPVAAAARSSATWAQRTAKDKRYTARKPRSAYEASFAASLMTLVILAAIVGTNIARLFPEEYDNALKPVLFLFASFWLTLLTAAGLLRFVYSFTNKATWYLILFLIVLWVFPPVGDLALEAIQFSSTTVETSAHLPRSMLFSCSPVGMWILLLTPIKGALMPGLVFQAVIASASLLLARRAKY